MPRGKTFRCYQYRFRVRSRGFSFPIDMLRYDGCYPATEEDARKLGASVDYQEDAELVLLKVWEPGWTPTTERWQSFLWDVVPGSLEILGAL